MRNKPSGHDWVEFVKKQPQLAEQVNFAFLEPRDWEELLEECPQFADKCPWEKLDDSNWR